MRFLGSFLLVMLFCISTLSAQTSDFGTWTTVGAEKKFGRFNVSGEVELRTKENVSAIDRLSLGLATSYQLLKPLQIGAGYDFIYFNDSEYTDFQPRHRANLFIEGKQKAGNFSFSLKEKIQVTAKDVSDRVKDNGNIDNYSTNPEYTWRNKLRMGFNIPNFRISPSLAVESFYSLNTGEGNSFEKIRYTLSVNYKLSKQHRIELYGLYNQKLNDATAINSTVVGISYQFKF